MLGSHCKAKTIGRGSSNEKSPFLLLPNQTKLAVPYDMKRSCINASSVPKKISGRLVQQYTNNMPCPFFISDAECRVKKWYSCRQWTEEDNREGKRRRAEWAGVCCGRGALWTHSAWVRAWSSFSLVIVRGVKLAWGLLPVVFTA